MNPYERWLSLKEQEDALKAERLALEEQIGAGIPEDWEGSKTWQDDESGLRIKATRRMNRKIDADTLTKIARDKGLEQAMGEVFRWKPELDMKAWRAADKAITEAFSPAITTTPGKVGFTVERMDG